MCSTNRMRHPKTMPIPSNIKTPVTAATPNGLGCAISVANLKQGNPPYHFSCNISMYPLLEYFAITADMLS